MKNTSGTIRELFDFRLFAIPSEIRILKEHLSRVETHIIDIQAKKDQKLEEEIRSQNLTPNDFEWDALLKGHHFWNRVNLSRMFRGPYLISLYSVYESSVLEVAKHLRINRSIQVSIESLRGNFPERARKYFTNVLDFPLYTNKLHWDRIKMLCTIRNAYAHTNGRMDMLSKNARNTLEALDNSEHGLSTDDGYLTVESELVHSILSAVSESLEDLVQRYKNWDDSNGSKFKRGIRKPLRSRLTD